MIPDVIELESASYVLGRGFDLERRSVYFYIPRVDTSPSPVDILREFIMKSRAFAKIFAKAFDGFLSDLADFRVGKTFDLLEASTDPLIGIRMTAENIIEDRAGVIHR